MIVEKGGADVNVINKISKTPLLYACSEKHLEMGKFTHGLYFGYRVMPIRKRRYFLLQSRP